jgi:hypothetical protein
MWEEELAKKGMVEGEKYFEGQTKLNKLCVLDKRRENARKRKHENARANDDTHHGSCAIWEIELLHEHQQCCPEKPTMEGHVTPLPALICPPRAPQE